MLSLPNRLVRSVALGAGGQIHGALRQHDARFWPTDPLHRREGVVGQHQRRGVGVANVFGSRNQEATCDELGVLSAFHHACQIIHGGIGVAGPNALDERAHHVVVLLAPLVVVGWRVLNGLQHLVVGDDAVAIGVGRQAVHDQFQGVQQPSGVATARPQQGFCFLQLDRLRRHVGIFTQRTCHEALEHFCREWLKHVGLTAAPQSRNDFERRVLRRGAQQRDGSRLHRTEQAVLLGL